MTDRPTDQRPSPEGERGNVIDNWRERPANRMTRYWLTAEYLNRRRRGAP